MERAARSLSDHQHRHPAVGQRSHAASDAEFVDNRPDAISQRTLAAAVNQSPLGTAQRALHTAIHRSPYMVAQRNKLRGAFGVTTQLEEGRADESFEQLPPEAWYVAQQRTEMPQPSQPATVPIRSRSGARSIVQRVSMTTLREKLADQPHLLNVFRYWIRFEMKQQGIEKHSVFLDDHSYLEVLESLQVWARPANFAYLRKSEQWLDEPTEQGNPKAPDPAKLKGEAVYDKTMEEHLTLARKTVLGSSLLVRKMNETEARILKAQGDDIDALRPKGLLNADAFPVERSIAFSVDGTHKFGDSKREKDASPTPTR
jgi:hypothetical protein